MNKELKRKLLDEFDEQFSENAVWWAECLSEMRVGDPDFRRLRTFISKVIDETILTRDKEWQDRILKDLKRCFWDDDDHAVGGYVSQKELTFQLIKLIENSHNE